MKRVIPVFCLLALGLFAEPPQATYAVVNFKECVEVSKMGKKEKDNFEILKNQMEKGMEEKEKALEELSKKLNDTDYVDSLSPEAEANLKHKFKMESQEMANLQNNYYQALNQANYKVLQKIGDEINKASQEIAKKKNLLMIVNSEMVFFYDPSLDITKEVVALLDSKEAK